MSNIVRLTRLYIIISLSLFSFKTAFAENPANNGSVKGVITTSDGKPAAYVTAHIQHTKKITLTDEQGSFALHNITPGSYTLEVSLVGYETKTKLFTVAAGKTTELIFSLSISNTQLQSVTVRAERTNKYTRQSSEYVAKVALTNLENPQVYAIVSKELLTDQMVFTVDDAVKNTPGIQKMWEATARSGDGGAYYNSRGFILQSKLRNGIAGNVSSSIDAANIESIEVIKGPSATLFGSALTSYGGLINRVTKKPYETFGGEISYAGGSYAYNRISADINTPLNDRKDLLLRLNTAYTTQGSFQDNGFARGYAIMPSLTYKMNDRLTLSFDAELFSGSNSSKQIIFFYYPVTQLNATNPKELGIDYKRSYSDPSIYQTYKNSNFFAQARYNISGKWVSQTNVSISNSFSNGPYGYYYVVPNSIATGDANAAGADYLARADQSTSNNTDNVIELQQNFTGDFNIGAVRNRFAGGIDFITENSNQLFYGADFDLIKKNGDIPNYNRFNMDNLNAVLQDTNKVWQYPYYYKNSTLSMYASDVVNVTNNLIVLAAVRIERFDNKGSFSKQTGTYTGGYNQTAVSPKFGLVYRLLQDKLSLFANYQNGFTNQTGTDALGHTFKPEQANQIEGGVKLNTFSGRLSGTLSYYDIQVKDIVRPDQTNPNFSIQDGTQVSKGFEADVTANPITGLNIVAGFAYNDSKLVKADADVEGRRPATAMSPVTANFWVSYKLPQGKAKGLGFGFGGNYASDNQILNSVYYGVFTLPAYTVLNATVFYETPKFRAGVKMDNLTNQQYWIGYTTMNPQPLRSVIGSIAFKF
ncbi:MAG TPA: TonB-dependent receptor [Chitinophagaceae bacterium]|nr:TonB-dependent receptor [Chitinophagaceae bacterium]